MTKVLLGDVPVAAGGATVWALRTGSVPYTTTFSVHDSQWPEIQSMMKTPQELKITGLNGEIVVKDVYPLHEVQSNSPNRRSFVVADRRWKWKYKVVIKDYNVTRKTGDRALLLPSSVPIELGQYVDRYRYMQYSIRNEEERWRGEDLIHDVLSKLEDADKFRVRSISVKADGEEGQLSIQNLLLRDPGDKALDRALTFVPGTQVYVTYDGIVEVFDGMDLAATDQYAKELGPITMMGEYPRKIDKRVIRPSHVDVYFVREMEIRFDHNENYGGTVVRPGADQPYMENVLPLPDPITYGVRIRDADGEVHEVDAPQGTYVPIREALRVWEEERQSAAEGSGDAADLAKSILPFSFDTIRTHWLAGNLQSVWGATGADVSEYNSAIARAGAVMQHFRRTFQINKRYMDRIREIRAVRAALLDPITGTRAPAMAWSEYTIVPSVKGVLVANRYNKDLSVYYIGVKSYPGLDEDLDSPDNPPSQARVSVVDGFLGIIRIDYVAGPYGFQKSFLPSLTSDVQGVAKGPRRNLALQDDTPIAFAQHVTGSLAVFLSPSFNIAIVLTTIPNAPNDKRQMHKVSVTADEIPEIFRKEYGIEAGDGPVQEVFVPPSVCTARFGWDDNTQCRNTVSDLFGLEADDAPGFDDPEENLLPGYLFVNGRDEIPSNSKAAAAEVLTQYADTWAGLVQTGPRGDVGLVGTMGGVTHSADPSPGGRVSTRHGFIERQRAANRFAMLPDTVRHITLGIIPYQTDGSAK